MKQIGIFGRILFPVVVIIVLLTAVLVGTSSIVFRHYQTKSVLETVLYSADVIAESVSAFITGAYNQVVSLAGMPAVYSMEADSLNPVFRSTAAGNNYMELLYIQDMDGDQIARSTGTLGNRKTRWWFVQMEQTEQPFVSPSYYSVGTGLPCASVFYPVYNPEQDPQRMTGILAVDIRLDYFQSIIADFSNAASGGYSFLIDGDGNIVSHPDTQYIEELYNYKTYTRQVPKLNAAGQKTYDAAGALETAEQTIEADVSFKKLISAALAGSQYADRITVGGRPAFVACSPVVLPGDSASWSVITVQDEKAAFVSIDMVFTIVIPVAFAVLVAACIIFSFIARSLSAHVRHVLPSLSNIAHGDFTQPLVARKNTPPEIGQIGQYINDVISQLGTVVSSIKTSSENIDTMTGRLDTAVVDSAGLLESADRTVYSMENALSLQNGKIAQSHESLANILESIRSLNSLISSQKNSVIAASSSISHMTDHIASVSENTQDVERHVNELFSSIEKVRALQNDMGKLVADTARQSESLSAVNHAIGAISVQTNLLAMNAAIEAAHAGASGKGFAVVAAEIRKLSEASSSQLRGAERNILDINTRIEAIVNLTNNFETVLAGIFEKATNVHTLSQENRGAITADSEESRIILQAVNTISDITENVAESSSAIEANMGTLSDGAAQLAKTSKELGHSFNDIAAAVGKISGNLQETKSISGQSRKTAEELAGIVSRFRI